MLESKLYLVFEFVPMDLKRYMDSIGDGKHLNSSLVKSLTYQVKNINELIAFILDVMIVNV